MLQKIKSYSELLSFNSFEERFEYLKLSSIVGDETFGSKRWLNQKFYRSSEYLRFRRQIILRDNGCDLGVDGFTIYGPIIVHHINPITYDDILERRPCIIDPDNAVCVSIETHRAIHYSDISIVQTGPIIRQKNDTCPWK